MTHNTIPFDTLHHFERMVEAGFTEKQAKAQTEAIAELVDKKLATKQDLNVLWLKITITFGSMLAIAIGILDFLLNR